MTQSDAQAQIDIDADRLWQRLMMLAEIGATDKGGVNRQALTDGDADAWRLVLDWGAEAGLLASTDPAANLFLTLPGTRPDLEPVMIGSHLDSQPTGGKFDGAFGVMAALEVVTALSANGRCLQRDIVVVAWMNEEGSRFAPGMMGSEAFTGVRDLQAIRSVVDADGVPTGQEIDRLHARFPGLPSRPLGFPVHAYIEPHIEQNILLEEAGQDIGIVTGIQGKYTYEVEILGKVGHAGTLPMADRSDAILAFARVAAALEESVGGHDRDVKFTIGRVEVYPNAPSVVPDRVLFRIDLRHPDNAVLDHCADIIADICGQHAAPCSITLRPLVRASSNIFNLNLRRVLQAAASRRHLSWMPVLSFAGHDARQMADHCASGMIFIPCRGGLSHVESEWAEPAYIGAGAQLLCDAVTEICEVPA